MNNNLDSTDIGHDILEVPGGLKLFMFVKKNLKTL
jgi:hypothetical protein